jgi:hypothetical protein
MTARGPVGSQRPRHDYTQKWRAEELMRALKAIADAHTHLESVARKIAQMPANTPSITTHETKRELQRARGNLMVAIEALEILEGA